jgi:hypothetical protein
MILTPLNITDWDVPGLSLIRQLSPRHDNSAQVQIMVADASSFMNYHVPLVGRTRSLGLARTVTLLMIL